MGQAFEYTRLLYDRRGARSVARNDQEIGGRDLHDRPAVRALGARDVRAARLNRPPRTRPPRREPGAAVLPCGCVGSVSAAGRSSNYPSPGPPTLDAPAGHLAHTDVNGTAGSIEAYLGRDVLTLPNGELRHVQWRSHIDGSKQHRYSLQDLPGVDREPLAEELSRGPQLVQRSGHRREAAHLRPAHDRRLAGTRRRPDHPRRCGVDTFRAAAVSAQVAVLVQLLRGGEDQPVRRATRRVMSIVIDQ